uniref:Unkown protein n=1 Tax=Riptortus pedestris TaxID=329032 RepID=R4WE40_RIPPE|nr:unkown protein [Riptortus pedestris]
MVSQADAQLTAIADNGLEVKCSEAVSSNELNIGKIKISDCTDVQFGPKFVASSITYVDKTKKRSVAHFVMIASILVLLTIMVVVLALKFGQGKNAASDITDTTEATTPQSTSPQTQPTSPTPQTPTTQQTPTDPPPPKEWYKPYLSWTNIPSSKCYPIIGNKATTVTVDSLMGACDTVDALRDLQNKSQLQHNFYISQECIVYEASGWGCSSEYESRYTRTNLNIAICGNINECQIIVLNQLLDKGKQMDNISKSFNLIPQCCRGLTRCTKPSKNMIDYLRGATGLIQTAFLNPACLDGSSCTNTRM